MVVFLPISDVMMTLNMDKLVAYVEFERWGKYFKNIQTMTQPQAYLPRRVSDERPGQN